MTRQEIKTNIIDLIKSRRTIGAYEICIVTGFSGTVVRRALREAKKAGDIDSQSGVYFPNN